jgi:hypothetical protein
MKNKSKIKEFVMPENKTKRPLFLRAYDPETGWLAQGITTDELSEVLKGLRKALNEAGFSPEEASDLLSSWFRSQSFFALPK